MLPIGGIERENRKGLGRCRRRRRRRDAQPLIIQGRGYENGICL